MLLIIPSIHIRAGVCSPEIGYFHNHHLPDYEVPGERSRLLRMENAKALHLFFDDSEPYSETGLALIRQIRTSIDVPMGLTLDAIPQIDMVKALFSSGIYRLYIKSLPDPELIELCIQTFSAQQFSFYISQDSNNLDALSALKSKGVCRVLVQASEFSDTELGKLDKMAAETQLRLSLVVRVFSYADFSRLRATAPNIDSIIFDDVLERDSFPCQQIWRLDEERAFKSRGSEANLWKNPLEGIPHI